MLGKYDTVLLSPVRLFRRNMPAAPVQTAKQSNLPIWHAACFFKRHEALRKANSFPHGVPQTNYMSRHEVNLRIFRLLMARKAESMKLNYLGHMNTIQVKEMEKKTSLAMLPIGPVEVHGPHLP